MDKHRFLDNFYSTSVGLLFFSYQKTAPFSSHESILTKINKSLNLNNTDVYNLFLWGDFDFTSLIYTNSTEELISLSRITPGIGPGIKSFTIILGTLIYSEPRFLSDLNNVKLPIKAIMSIKCNKSFIKFSRHSPQLHDNVNSFFYDFISLCISCKNNVLENSHILNGDISLQIIAPYSWEDFIIILNSNSLELIKDFLVSIRQSTFKKVEPGKRHLLFSSNSLIGLPLFDPSDYPKRLGEVTANVIDNDIHWCVKIRIRPGHANWVLDYFSKNKQNSIPYNIYNLIGTYDVMIQSKNHVRFSSFINWFFKELSPNLKIKGSAILTAKTDFMLNFDLSEPLETATIVHRDFDFLKESLRIRNLSKDLLPEHILSALVSIASTFEYLVSQHTTISKEFNKISTAFILFLKTFENEILQDIAQLQNQEEYPEIIQNVAEIIEEFSYIFGERFRGGHPVGKTLSELPTVTYSGSFHKILQGIDFVINSILIDSGKFIQGYSYNSYKQYSNVCCRIRNIDSPCNRLQFKNAFIHFPLDTLLFQENWYYILHEVGHVLMEEMLLLLSDVKPDQLLNINKNKLLLQEIKELFADAFSLTILFNGDVDSYMKFLNSYCKRIMKWNIPDITFELRYSLLNIFNTLNGHSKMRINPGILNSLYSIAPNNKSYIKKLVRNINKIVNDTDILIWLRALKIINITDEIIGKLTVITELANNFYYGNRNDIGETHMRLHKMRRELIHDFWFRSAII